MNPPPLLRREEQDDGMNWQKGRVREGIHGARSQHTREFPGVQAKELGSVQTDMYIFLITKSPSRVPTEIPQITLIEEIMKIQGMNWEKPWGFHNQRGTRRWKRSFRFENWNFYCKCPRSYQVSVAFFTVPLYCVRRNENGMRLCFNVC